MSKTKDWILTIIEEYESGISIPDIANLHGMSIDEVENILERFS